MGSEAQDAKRKITLEEIQELYDRLGIPRRRSEPTLPFEEYAWRYGFKPQDKRTRTTIDTHTSQRE